jgi:hypothetical protein
MKNPDDLDEKWAAMPAAAIGVMVSWKQEMVRTHQIGERHRSVFVDSVARDWCRFTPLEKRVVPSEDQIGDLLQLGMETANFYRDQLRNSYTAEPGMAVQDDDEENPGRYKIVFRTLEGNQTIYRGLRPKTADIDPPASARPADQWHILQDQTTAPANRASAFSQLFDSVHHDPAIEYLAAELDRNDLAAEWQDTLVFMAERVHFPANLRPRIGERLLAIAGELCAQPDGNAKVVWSALRRAASLLPADQVDRLVPFLTHDGSVDTRAVALQGVARVFEAGPPMSPPAAVTDRAADFASKIIDRDVLTPGEVSVVGRNAVAALAATGDPRLQFAINRVSALGRPWLTRRVRDELTEIGKAWKRRGIPADHSAVVNLENALAQLK